jgi:hypothetical protein
MSHYTKLETKLTSREHLVRALADVGFPEVEVHERPQPLVGWLGDLRTQSAEVIVRRQNVGLNSNDLGFARDQDGNFCALISDFDGFRFNTTWLKRLHQRYAYHVSRDRLTEQGFDLVAEERTDDGSIRLTLRRMT